MKRHLLGTVGLILAAAIPLTAQAADIPAYAPQAAVAPMPQPTAYDWTGVYVGAHVGYGFGEFDDFTPSLGTGFTYDGNGFFGGVQAGYNAQYNQVVLGVEADASWSGIDGDTTVPAGAVDTKLDWLSTVRGRVGYAVDRYLVYGTGGVAFGALKTEIGGASDKQTSIGWTLGAGVEAAITQNVTAKIEYLYTDLGKEKFNIGGTQENVDWDGHAVKLGVNYKF